MHKWATASIQGQSIYPQVKNIKYSGTVNINTDILKWRTACIQEKDGAIWVSMVNINRIINPTTTETIELEMIDYDILFTDGVVSTPGVTAGQNEDQATMDLVEIWVC